MNQKNINFNVNVVLKEHFNILWLSIKLCLKGVDLFDFWSARTVEGRV